MENKKINISELLKDCPSGMELYSPLCGTCVFDRLNMGTIICKKQNTEEITFTSEGYYMLPVFDDCECMLFPSKDQRDWNEFQGHFKDGDIISDSLGTCIFKGEGTLNGTVDYYCGVHGDYFNVKQKPDGHYGDIVDYRFATKEEKRKLFDAIKENGYKWNADTKILEKIVEPKFKVGDRITNGNISITIDYMDNECYYDIGRNTVTILFIKYQDDWKLVPNKFDISTLIPYESKVLIRNTLCGHWEPAFWGAYTIDHSDGLLQHHDYLTTKGFTNYCIPYEGNEHLMGKTDDCIEYYKTWYTDRALLDYNDDFLVDKETNMNEDNNQETLETKTTEGVIVCNEFCDCYNPKDDVYGNKTTEKIPLEQSKQCKDIDDVRHVNSITDDIMINQITSKVSVIKFNPDVCDNEIELQLGNYKIEVRDGKTYAVKNKPKYPKTYKECCDILGYNASYDLNNITTHDCVYDYKLQMFYRVLICCDAYCKIVGEQMGLEKPWEPDWKDSNFKYCLKKIGDNIEKSSEMTISCILAFPTEEMRDIFYENFKDLIEECKGLL